MIRVTQVLDHYLDAWRRYGDFSGRADREAFWCFFIVNFGITVLLDALDQALSLPPPVAQGLLGEVGLISLVYALMIFLPSLTMATRRLHDSGRSAAWLLLALVPFLGHLALLVVLAMPGESHSNRFGHPVW